MNEYVTVTEAASELGVSGARVRQWIQAGSLPAVKRGNANFILRSDVARMRDRNRKPGPRAKATA